MKPSALIVLAVLGATLPACTTLHPDRRQMTEWNWSLVRQKPDPCGTMPKPDPYLEMDAKGPTKCGGNLDAGGNTLIDWVLVKPVAIVMLPVSWLTDTLLLNPINGYKKAELQNYERRFCEAEMHPEWSDARAAHNAYGVVPVLTPWIVSDALAAPEFAARWLWNSTAPTSPVNDANYEAYWREHNESTGEGN